MQYQLLALHAVFEAGFVQERGSQFTGLMRMHFPAHNGAAVDVLDHVEAVVLPCSGAWQIGDIPTPEPIGGLGCKGLGPCCMAWHVAFTAMVALIVGPQYPVEAGLTGHVHPLLSRGWHDLRGRQALVAGAIAHLHNRLLLLGAERMRCAWPVRLLAAIVQTSCSLQLQAPTPVRAAANGDQLVAAVIAQFLATAVCELGTAGAVAPAVVVVERGFAVVNVGCLATAVRVHWG